jgi:hypothetical protein
MTREQIHDQAAQGQALFRFLRESLEAGNALSRTECLELINAAECFMLAAEELMHLVHEAGVALHGHPLTASGGES